MTGDKDNGELAVGDELSGYRLTARLGEGGMAAVFRGENLLDASIVRAVKVVHAELGARREFVKRFAIEARTLERLSHPNVVRFFGVRQDRGRLVMELELLEGQTLAAKLATGLPLADVTRWMLNTADGLVAAHALGVLHRDIKPENLFLTSEGVVKILDFGIARALDDAEGATRQTAEGTTPGTAAYLAPESWRGAAPSAATDVYAVGLTLLELALGHHPFMPPGVGRKSSAQLMYAHLEAQLPPLRSVRSDASGALEAVVAKATARDPAQRYATAAELAAALRTALDAPPEAAAEARSNDASTSFALAHFDPTAQAAAEPAIPPSGNADAGEVETAPQENATSFAIAQFEAAPAPDAPREKKTRPPAEGGPPKGATEPVRDAAARGKPPAPERITAGAPSPGRRRAYLLGAVVLVVGSAAVVVSLRRGSGAQAEAPSASSAESGKPDAREAHWRRVTPSESTLAPFDIQAERPTEEGIPFSEAMTRCAALGATLPSEEQWMEVRRGALERTDGALAHRGREWLYSVSREDPPWAVAMGEPAMVVVEGSSPPGKMLLFAGKEAPPTDALLRMVNISISKVNRTGAIGLEQGVTAGALSQLWDSLMKCKDREALSKGPLSFRVEFGVASVCVERDNNNREEPPGNCADRERADHVGAYLAFRDFLTVSGGPKDAAACFKQALKEVLQPGHLLANVAEIKPSVSKGTHVVSFQLDARVPTAATFLAGVGYRCVRGGDVKP